MIPAMPRVIFFFQLLGGKSYKTKIQLKMLRPFFQIFTVSDFHPSSHDEMDLQNRAQRLDCFEAQMKFFPKKKRVEQNHSMRVHDSKFASFLNLNEQKHTFQVSHNKMKRKGPLFFLRDLFLPRNMNGSNLKDLGPWNFGKTSTQTINSWVR